MHRLFRNAEVIADDAYCWHDCGQTARMSEPLGMAPPDEDDEDGYIIEVGVCGRPWCLLLAGVRQMAGVAVDIVTDLVAKFWRR